MSKIDAAVSSGDDVVIALLAREQPPDLVTPNRPIGFLCVPTTGQSDYLDTVDRDVALESYVCANYTSSVRPSHGSPYARQMSLSPLYLLPVILTAFALATSGRVERSASKNDGKERR